VICPVCQSATQVLESRPASGGNAVRRRRRCADCGHRFTTFERREAAPLYVGKRSGERQRFDRIKLRAALLHAAHKRPVSSTDVEQLVDRIESSVSAEGGEVAAERIVELCLEGLRELDVGAYLQFAGTLDEPEFAISGQTGPAGSVRLAREDSQFPPKPAPRRGSDE
jgi:transcriptional repressor NrdR